MSQYSERYNRLNDEQREAVNTIFDHLLVIAGPGSGKTELLSVRIAHILNETDTLPQNILCLTFTEAAASNMRSRLQSLIGEAAFHVAIHTFHSFGSRIFSEYPEYLDRSVKIRAADEEDKYRILEDVFTSLNSSNPLGVWNEYSGYYYIDSAVTAISNLRRQGITPDILSSTLDANDSFAMRASALVSEVFSDRLNKDSIPKAIRLADELGALESGTYPSFIRSLQSVLVESLALAAEEAERTGKTAHLSEWKRIHTEKNDDGVVLKALGRTEKLRGLQEVYTKYLEALKREQLFDFDDMILEAAEVIRENASIRADLQERYQFVLVDEYQDTSGAQLSLLTSFVDADRTNVMAVGDDDQSIFAFQGAEIGNILSFAELFQGAKHIVLKHNYRSHECITSTFKELAEHIPGRLSDIADFEKAVVASGGHSTGTVERLIVDDSLNQYNAVLNEITALGDDASVAVLAKKHQDLERMAHILAAENIQFSYERQENVLDSDIAHSILSALRFASAASEGRARSIDAELVKLLSAPHFGAADLYVYEWTLIRRKLISEGKWTSALEYFKSNQKYMELGRYLAKLVSLYSSAPASKFLEHLFSSKEPLSLRSSYFANLDSDTYMHSRMYREIALLANQQPISCERLLAKLERMTLWNIRVSAKDSDARISLISAHGSKGLEFDHVFLLSTTEELWFSAGGSLNIGSHENLPLERKSTRADALRLLFVAASRARNGLHFMEPQLHEGKAQHTVSALEGVGERYVHLPVIDIPELLHARFEPNEERIIRSQLESLVLTPSHISTYLNVVHAGPRAFLERSVYKFPTERSESLMLGQSLHGALEIAFKEKMRSDNPQIATKLLELMTHEGLAQDRLDALSDDLTSTLTNYLQYHEGDLASEQFLEYSLKHEHIYIADIPVTGVIDRLQVNSLEKSLKIIDYKYTSLTPNWHTRSDAQRVKQFDYRLQLLFYVQLIRRSKKFAGFNMQSPELHLLKNDIGKHILSLDIDEDQIIQHEHLLKAVYTAIRDLYFPDAVQGGSIDDILRFEDDVLKKYG